MIAFADSVVRPLEQGASDDDLVIALRRVALDFQPASKVSGSKRQSVLEGIGNVGWPVGYGVHSLRHVLQRPLDTFAIRRVQELVGVEREDEIGPRLQRLPCDFREARRLEECGIAVQADAQRQAFVLEVGEDLARAVERSVVDVGWSGPGW